MRRTLGDDPPAAHARARSHVYHVVGAGDHVEVVLDQHHRVAPREQVANRPHQAICVARVQAEGRLVENVRDAAEPPAELRRQPSALEFSIGEGPRGSVDRDVLEASAHQISEPPEHLGPKRAGHGRQRPLEAQPAQDLRHRAHRERRDRRDGAPLDREREGLGSQASARAPPTRHGRLPAQVGHRLVETEASTVAEAAAAFRELDQHGWGVEVLAETEEGLQVRVVEHETSAARIITVPAALFASPIYQNARRAYRRLVEQMGEPPFTLRFGKKSLVAMGYAELRAGALELAKEGMQVSRFKGLGEMNADQLWETTMDPSKRLLIRVDVEDAARADHVFSTLMGDQVEPRREFIEQNARDVRFLDV